ncbi:ABC transporter ATP-binding protein [Anaeromicropila herbilytica]
MRNLENNLIEVEDLQIYFRQKKQKLFSFNTEYLKAVDHVSFTIKRGETFGLVGESGSGKSTVGKGILRYYNLTGGNITFDGTEIGYQKEKELLPIRKKMQSIFQDPYASLDPSHTVKDIICEPMEIHKLYDKSERKERACELLEMVGMNKNDILRYPHEFSGGQRQRISIARALSINPQFILCDEPISALDVSLQAQIVHLLEGLQDKLGLTYLFISHQLQMVQQICDNIGVMFLGNLVELSDADDLYKNPLHPYTKMLLSSMLEADPGVRCLEDDIPEYKVMTRVKQGCKFSNRCPYANSRCKEEVPKLKEVAKGHYVACFQYEG